MNGFRIFLNVNDLRAGIIIIPLHEAVLLDKLAVDQLVKIFPVLYGIKKFISMYTSAKTGLFFGS
jgi:hypothetical protein